MDVASRKVVVCGGGEGFAGITVKRKYFLNAPRGVQGRNRDNTLVQARLGWEPSTLLKTQVEALACV